MPTLSFKSILPSIGSQVFIAPTAWITGDTKIGSESSVFFGAVIRGDVMPVRIGSRTNIQEHAMLHTSNHRTPCIVGDEVTIGHSAIVHGCKVGNRCIIGINSVILDEAEIGDDCIIGANSLVTSGTVIPPRSMAFGNPAKVIRALNPSEIASLKESALHYVEVAKEYLRTISD